MRADQFLQQVSDIKFEPKKVDGRLKCVPKWSNDKPVKVLSPNVRCPWGVSLPDLAAKPYPKPYYTISVSRDEKSGGYSSQVKALFDGMEASDAHFIRYLAENKEAQQLFLGKSGLNEQSIREFMFNETVKWPQDEKKREQYGPSLRPRITEEKEEVDGEWVGTGRLKAVAMFPDKSKHDISELAGRGFVGMLLLNLISAYSTAGKTGLRWTVSKVVVLHWIEHEDEEIDVNAYGENPDYDAACIAALEQVEHPQTLAPEVVEPLEDQIQRENEELLLEEEEDEPSAASLEDKKVKRERAEEAAVESKKATKKGRTTKK